MKILLILIFTLFTTPLYACKPLNLNKVLNFSNYSDIFIGEVTGVHLNEYEKIILEDVKAGRYGPLPIKGSKDHTLHIVVTKTFTGNFNGKLVLKTGGCNIMLPTLKERGIFLIDKKTSKVLPIYESRKGGLYIEVVDKLQNR